MTLYILKSTIIIGILLAVYHLFLEKEKMHRFNRYYLLSGLVLAFATPLITVGTIAPEASSSIIESAPIIIQEIQSEVILQSDKGLDWMIFFLGAYVLIAVILFLRFINNIGILLLKSIRNPKVGHNDYSMVLVEENVIPHTFFKYVFINKIQYKSDDIEPEILIHESTHARQLHTLDIMSIELVKVFYWFNPLIYFYKRAIQLNHEFLADQEVVQSNTEVPEYQRLLLNKASVSAKVNLASNLNFSVTKKRLEMMTKPISKRRNLIYGLMIIPITIFVVSCLGNYDTVELSHDSLISQHGDIVSVDFRNRNAEQLEQIKNEMKLFNIDVVIDHIKYDASGIMSESVLFADFNNGNTALADFENNSGTEPYGFWLNLENGHTGVGKQSCRDTNQKRKLLEKMKLENESGASFYIYKDKVTFEQAAEWLEKTELWQSRREHLNNVSYSFRSSYQSCYPFTSNTLDQTLISTEN